MAVLCLTTGLADLERRLGNIVVGRNRDKAPVTAAALEAAGAMTVLLRDALMPNLVQTMENNPAIVHGGPFANIAHGCNSVLATRAALKLGEYAVTEAGFGADLGAEKFFDIKCRKAGLVPAAAVIVATVRALKMHGGVRLDELDQGERRGGQCTGSPILPGTLPMSGASASRSSSPSIALLRTRRPSSTWLQALCSQLGVEAVRCTHFAEGGKGAVDLAEKVVSLAENATPRFSLLYPDDMPLWDKARTIARTIYGADDIVADKARPRPVQRPAGRGLRLVPDLHREDAVFLFDRPQSQGRADRPPGSDSRASSRRGRRIHRRDRRRHHDHAGPAESSCGQPRRL